MRLSWAILSCHTIILMLSCLALGMEIFAFLHDLKWNAMVENPKERYSQESFAACKIYNGRNSTFRSPTKKEYENSLTAHKRDLPFEFAFLVLMGVSFVMYAVLTGVYICWKNVIGNIYICITWNLLGTFIHLASFGLILASTLIYTDKSRKYMGSPSCYTFNCAFEQGEENCASKQKEAAKGYYYETRACMENLNICQLNGFKDRVVYLIFGCIVTSTVALISSCRRLRRKRHHKITPNPPPPRLLVDEVEQVKNSIAHSSFPPEMRDTSSSSSTD